MASVRKIYRKKGTAYQVDVRDPYTGRRKRITFEGTESEARKMASEIEGLGRLQKRGLLRPKTPDISFDMAEKEYLTNSALTKSPNTTLRERNTLRAFSRWRNGGKLNDITTHIIEQFKAYRMKTCRPATVSIDLRILKTFFNYMIHLEWLDRNPVSGVAIPSSMPDRIRYLTKSELSDFRASIDEPNFLDLADIYPRTGARTSELLSPNFTWESVDFLRRIIVLKGKGGKTRVVPMDDTVKAILERRKTIGHEVPFKYSPGYVTHKFAKYFNKAGVKNASVQSLRRTFGSLLLQNGITDIFTVSKLLGHSSVKVTEQHYVDLLDENYHSVVARLDELLLQ